MNYAQFAFDRIGAIERATTPSAVMFEIQKGGSEFGLDCFLTAGIPGPKKSFEPYVLLHNWPTGWFKRYMDENYLDIDPVIVRVRNSLEPFAWSEVRYDRRKQPKAHKVMCEATEFRLKAGFSVPIINMAGDQAGMTFGGDVFDAPSEARQALNLIAVYGHAKARALMLARKRPVRPPPKLSDREIEILQWCADGATAASIAEKLSVSESTVTTYVTRACRKLGSTNRTQAVAEAMRARLIF